ncbi:MAG TPA: carboxypeptidase regulatory-like domain-containing protein [Candidatus Acidoferrum sp.]|nr:carboxypeptidase regulatory-like domain-containing protein [Candidatus Acidoferrum sp.]
MIRPSRLLARLSATLTFFFLLLFSGLSISSAQYTAGTIQGAVFDPQGRVISDAEITLQNLDTNESKMFQTGPNGIFYFSAVSPGRYLLTAGAPGFAEASAKISALSSQTVTQNLTLAISGQASQVVVTSESAALTDRTDPQLSTTYGVTETDNLPTNSRSFNAFSTLVSLVPGATPAYSPAGGGGLVKVGGAQTGLISSNGGRPENTNVEFDFADANDWEFGGVALGTMPAPDMVQELKVLASNLPAEYGTKSNGTIAVISKSGTNDWHGQLYNYLKNDAFNARDFFDTTGKATRIDENDYGFSMGGPAIRDKTFLFGGWEQNKTIGGGFTDLALVPSDAARQTVTDPAVATLINQFLPEPTGATNNPSVGAISSQFSAPTDNYQFLIRGDQLIGHSHTLSLRYFQATGTSVLPFPQFNTLSGFDADLHYEARNANVTDTWQVSPLSVNQFRVAYARSSGLLPPEGNLQSARYDILDGSIASFGALPFFTQGRIFNVFQGNDVLSRAAGKHELKLGFDFRYIQDNSVNQTNDRGEFFFSSIANFLAAQPESYTRAFGPTELGFRERLLSAFVQDDYRISPTLTIDLGVRWEYQGYITEAHGLTSLLDPTLPANIGMAGPGPLGSFFIGNPSVNRNPLNFAPRLGFAWNPQSGSFVLRGGYGIYYSAFAFTPLSEARTSPPINYTFSLTDFSGGNNFDSLVSGTAPFIQQSQAAVGSFGSLLNFGTITTVDRTMPNPYVQQWNLTAEYQLSRSTVASVGYVGSQGTHLQAFIPINPIAPANAPAPATSLADEEARIGQFLAAATDAFGPGNNRVDPRFDQVNRIAPAASSTYNSLQLNLRGSYGHGLTFQAAYTYSRSIDNSSSSNPNQESFDPGVQQNVNSLSLERGPSNFDIPHRFVVTGVWQLPFFADRDGLLANLLLKGWEFDSVSLWQAGIPANIYSGPVTVPNPTDPSGTGYTTISDVNIDGVTTPAGADNTRANCAAVGRGFTLGDAASIAEQTRFSQPFLGNDGTCGRNIYRLNGLSEFDWTLAKSFLLRESGVLGSGPWRLQFRADLFNILNHPNLTVSNASVLTLTNPRFGLFDTAGAPRTIQFALKLYW